MCRITGLTGPGESFECRGSPSGGEPGSAWLRLNDMMRASLGPMLLLLIATGCGTESPAVRVGSDGDGATVATTPAAQLDVTCTETSTAVGSTAVEAGPHGVQVRVVDETALDLRVYLVNPAAAQHLGRWAYGGVEGAGGVAEIHPGRVLVRCVDENTPEHSERVDQSAEAREVEVVAAEGAWRAPQPLSCDGMTMHGSRDFVAPDPAQPPSRGFDDPEAAVRGDGEIAALLDPTDELTTAGYRDSASAMVQVLRRGSPVISAATQRGSTGWSVTGFGACAPLPAPASEK